MSYIYIYIKWVNKTARKKERKKERKFSLLPCNMFEMLPFNCSWDFWERHSNAALHIGKTEISSSHLRHCKSVPSKNIMPTPHSFDSHACHLTLYSEIGTSASLWVSILALIVQKGLDMTTAVTWPPSFPDDAIQAFMWPERVLNHMAVTDFTTYICAYLKAPKNSQHGVSVYVYRGI